jgi:hypothetical protein
MRNIIGNERGFIAGLLIAVAGVAAFVAIAAYAHSVIQQAIEECGRQDRVWTECLKDEE